MKAFKLRDYQFDAIKRMKNGCILCGDVGSGKSCTSLAYFYLLCGGSRSFLDGGSYLPMTSQLLKNLFIITTARKRDTLEWESEMAPFLLSTNPEACYYKDIKVVVDSWNNIGKYKDVKDSFFIFDEQRVIGRGSWVKSFYKIAKSNQWILLSATPGDTWSDYIPVFVANGFYKNRTQFSDEHIVWSRFTKWPQIERYIGEGKLIKYRNDILVEMNFKRETSAHHEYFYCNYDRDIYRNIMRFRMNPWTGEPIENASQFCYLLRKVVNTSDDRQLKLLEIAESHERMIIFYNYDYELEILRAIEFPPGYKKAEYNGHKHDPLPKSLKWAYFVQYTSGCEGWNCIETDTTVFFSQNYSYRVMKQASGRIDRMNTPFKDLYYYHLSSKSPIDISITRAVDNKKNFNESMFTNKIFKGK